jgi:hypothetical protein
VANLSILTKTRRIQGLDPDEEIGEYTPVVGAYFVDYDTGAIIDYKDASAVNAPAPSLTVSEVGSYEEDYVPIPDPKFLSTDDEWLAKVRQVLTLFS